MSDEPTDLPPENPSAPPSGRGKQLTQSQEAALIRICKERQGDCHFKDQKKSFWVKVSAALAEETGRLYSWQSCQRRMSAWESAFLRAPYVHKPKPLYPPAIGYGQGYTPITASAPVAAAAASEESNSVPSVAEWSEDDMLPERPVTLPRVVDAVIFNQQRIKLNELRGHHQKMIGNTLSNVGAQLQILIDALTDEGNDCDGIKEAVSHLHDEISLAMDKYLRAVALHDHAMYEEALGPSDEQN
jgi:hypothetical protein